MAAVTAAAGRMRALARGFGAALLLAAALPAAAQFSDSYTFLKAVRDADAAKATELANRPGSTVANTRDPGTGETGLHIATRRRDPPWMGFMITHGADLNARDAQGETPLLAAARIGYTDGADLLLRLGASVDAASPRGETPLIVAVQTRNLGMARLLVAGGANPRIADHVAGRSALDYAQADPRAGPIVQVLQSARAAPPKRIVGPQR